MPTDYEQRAHDHNVTTRAEIRQRLDAVLAPFGHVSPSFRGDMVTLPAWALVTVLQLLDGVRE